MSTHSFIGKQNQDGSIRAIYCHFDGYPKHVGKMLKEHYTTDSKVDELLDLGDLSSLGENPAPDPNWHHSFDGARQPCVCLAYGRDRGEEGVETKECVDRDDFIRKAKYHGAHYQYLYTRSGKWKEVA
jgi:hypothetical protein